MLFGLCLLLLSPLDLGELLIEVTFAAREAVRLLDDLTGFGCGGFGIDGNRAVALREAVLFLAEVLVLDALGNGHHVAVQRLNLRHKVNYLGTVVRLLSEWVAEQV